MRSMYTCEIDVKLILNNEKIIKTLISEKYNMEFKVPFVG